MRASLAREPATLRWLAAEGHATHAVELSGRFSSSTDLLRAASHAADEGGFPTFLIATLSSVSAEAVVACLHVAERFSSRHRCKLVLALNAGTLAAAGRARVDLSSGGGSIVDDVCLDTPLGVLLQPHLLGVRFSEDFLRAAAEHVQTGLALGALAELATNLGLITFARTSLTMPPGFAPDYTLQHQT